VRVSQITERAAGGLSETVTPQGIVAVCALLDRPLEQVLPPTARLTAVLVDVSDPGNAGTVIRVADAAGADAVILAGDSVDPHNGKCVRASAGSLFHLPVSRVRDTGAALRTCRDAGLRLLGAHGYAETELDSLDLSMPAAWIFGNEAHGLPATVLTAVDVGVRIPIYGKAESLNLATAAAVCLYGSAMALRRSCGG
jgi:TrmH family RNA methyltransferase